MIKLIMGVFCLGLLLPLADGGPIGTYVFTGTASGSIGGTVFSAAPLTIKGVGDTQNVAPGFINFNELDFAPGSATVAIGGVGTATFNNLAFIVDNYGNGVLIFGGLFNQGNATGLISMTNAAVGSTAFSNYFLKTSLGPIGDVTDDVTSWQGISTSLGSLTVNSYTHVSFQATVTPELGTVVLLGSGLFMVLLRIRTKGGNRS